MKTSRGSFAKWWPKGYRPFTAVGLNIDGLDFIKRRGKLVLISAARLPIHDIDLKHPRSNLGHRIQIGRFTLNARRVMERFNRVRPTSIQRRRGFLPHVTRPRMVALEQGRRRHGRCCPHCAPGPQAQIRMLQHRMEYESKVPGDFYLDIGRLRTPPTVQVAPRRRHQVRRRILDESRHSPPRMVTQTRGGCRWSSLSSQFGPTGEAVERHRQCPNLSLTQSVWRDILGLRGHPFIEEGESAQREVCWRGRSDRGLFIGRKGGGADANAPAWPAPACTGFCCAVTELGVPNRKADREERLQDGYTSRGVGCEFAVDSSWRAGCGDRFGLDSGRKTLPDYMGLRASDYLRYADTEGEWMTTWVPHGGDHMLVHKPCGPSGLPARFQPRNRFDILFFSFFSLYILFQFQIQLRFQV
jgi:hypothetical protein